MRRATKSTLGRALAAALGGTLAAGCAGPFTDVTKTNMGYMAPTDPNKVEVLYTAPRTDYTEVGFVLTEGWDLHDVAKMHNALRDKAAGVGGNAIILFQPHYTVAGFWNTTYLGYTGVAIYKK